MGWWNFRNWACRKYPPSPGRPGKFSRGWPVKPYRGSPTRGWPMDARPHAQGVDVALAAFGGGKGSAKMPEEEVRKIEIAYPQAFCRAAKAGGARVCGLMTAV